MECLDDAAEHVEHAGPGRDAVAHGERPLGERAHGEDGVVMAEDQHPGVAATLPVHVGAGLARDQCAGPAEVAFDHRGKRDRRHVERVEVERRRLDLDQRGEVGEHRIEIEHVGRDQLGHPCRLRLPDRLPVIPDVGPDAYPACDSLGGHPGR